MSATAELFVDPALPGLAVIRAQGLGAALPELDLGDRPVELRLCSHAPGSRATFEVRAGDRRFAIKLYADDAAPEAERHDATQIPAWHGQAAREAEALDRIARWHGPGERYAALLALLVEPGDSTGWAAWSHATANLPLADSVRRELDALGPPSRMQVFETLARRSAAAPRAELLALLRAARAQRAGASGRLRWLALRRLLRARPARLPTAEPADSLAALWPQVVAATACLAITMRLDPQDASTWQSTALRELRSDAASPTPSAASAVAALQLRRLSAMQRPQLACAWVEAMPSARLDDAWVCDALQMACWLLDTPLPPALAQRRLSAQLRNL